MIRCVFKFPTAAVPFASLSPQYMRPSQSRCNGGDDHRYVSQNESLTAADSLGYSTSTTYGTWDQRRVVSLPAICNLSRWRFIFALFESRIQDLRDIQKQG